jgi:hypothetical protein
MKTLRDKLKPVLKRGGVFYPNLIDEKTEYLIVLEEILNKKGRVLGFKAYQKLTGEPYSSNVAISKKGGTPEKYTILDNEALIDHAEDISSALYKAHEYLLGKILDDDILACRDVSTNLLDATKIGRRKFNKNKANLSEQKSSKNG